MRVIFSILVLTLCGCAHPSASTSGGSIEVRRAVLGFMLERWGSGSSQSEYSAHVVPKELVGSFGNVRLPVVAPDEKRYATNSGLAVDTVTGKGVVMWSVSAEKIEGESATCYVNWYIGNLGAGGHTVFLKKQGGTWVGQRHEMMWISQKPNKAPEPTPGSVTPRATEGVSK
jgi:hypothetical protein